MFIIEIKIANLLLAKFNFFVCCKNFHLRDQTPARQYHFKIFPNNPLKVTFFNVIRLYFVLHSFVNPAKGDMVAHSLNN